MLLDEDDDEEYGNDYLEALGLKNNTFVPADLLFPMGMDNEELEDEEDDPDVKNDPLYQLNLKVHNSYVCSLYIFIDIFGTIVALFSTERRCHFDRAWKAIER